MSDSTTTLNLTVSSRIQELAAANERQGQVTVSHAEVQRLLSMAKLDKETVLSRRRGLGLTVTVRTQKGTEVPLLMADTHSIWFSHQSDKNSRDLVSYMVKKGGGVLDVVNVKPTVLATTKRKAVTAEDMSDCPI